MNRTEYIYSYFKGVQGPILDAGCNKGELGYKDPEKFVGVDTWENENPPKGLATKRADLNAKLPFQDGFFSAVCCTETLEHLNDPVFTMKEFNRVLKPNGFALISVPCNKYHLAYHFGHKNFFHHGRRDIEILARWSGFEPVEITELRGLRYGLPAAKLLPKLGFHGIIYAKLVKRT